MDIAKRTEFLKQILTAEEYQEIEQNKEAFQTCLDMYSEEYIDSVNVYEVNSKRFIVAKTDVSKLPKTWSNTLEEVSHVKQLLNPVYIEVDTDGELLLVD